VDAVGMEAHGSPMAAMVQRATGLMPKRLAGAMMQRGGIDRMAALYTAIDAVRRGGTISLSGVYGGQTDPLPMLTLFDKQITLRMGQANVRRWIDDILPLLDDEDVLGVDGFATHHVALEDAPQAYADFQQKANGTVKVVFHP
jgi:threonine dehydrogenase-like Zn-dependent dehydrogenase